MEEMESDFFDDLGIVGNERVRFGCDVVCQV